MRIEGSWLVCDDHGIRPVVRVEVLTGNGEWKSVNFLLDTGADRTVFDARLLALLQIETAAPGQALEGVGGLAHSVVVETQIRFTKKDGEPVLFGGQFSAFTEPEALDMCVLGRNITNLFAVIVDRPKDVVCLLGQRHSYTIVES